MPAFVGAVNVNSMGTAAVFNIGDVYTIAPESSAKTFSGAGSFNTAERIQLRNDYSVTNTYDNDLYDQPVTGNL
ncbi:spore germination protein [Bacillus solimangrovi]|uniref:Spore gernimation protein GerPA n=1 Tax=Bacillus solimangrovi TaxID=1305675 RepID=A0A1E5LC43_9BACI|nr:spore germination protein [Bacillus solimangrovi]OEH91668.1 spore gernimation protein GerPA [Bacillus solimangrovi]